MRYGDLTDEQKGKVANAKGPEGILEMAKAEGYKRRNSYSEQRYGRNL